MRNKIKPEEIKVGMKIKREGCCPGQYSEIIDIDKGAFCCKYFKGYTFSFYVHFSFMATEGFEPIPEGWDVKPVTIEGWGIKISLVILSI